MCVCEGERERVSRKEEMEPVTKFQHSTVRTKEGKGGRINIYLYESWWSTTAGGRPRTRCGVLFWFYGVVVVSDEIESQRMFVYQFDNTERKVSQKLSDLQAIDSSERAGRNVGAWPAGKAENKFRGSKKMRDAAK